MKNNLSLLVADDHPLLRRGLVDELLESGYTVVAQATTGAEALSMLEQHRPQIALLDVKMPLLSGIEVIQKAKQKGIATKFILITQYKESGLLFEARRLGVNGYLLKEEPFEEIEKCITAVSNGKTWFSQAVKRTFQNNVDPNLKKLKYLTPSERTIVRMIAQDKNSREIAEDLSISKRTVEKHRSNIINKLGLSSDEDSLSFWIRQNKSLILSL